MTPAVDKGYVRCCIDHLGHMNPDTFNEFKKQIQFTGIQFPLIEVFIECQSGLALSIQNRQKTAASVQENNVKQLKPIIIAFLTHVLNGTPMEKWEKLSESQNPEESIKEILISLEYLFKVELSGFDQEKKVREWIDLANTKLNDIQDDEMRGQLGEVIRNLSEEVVGKDKKCLMKTIRQAQAIFSKNQLS